MKYLGSLLIMCGCITLSYYYEKREKARIRHLSNMCDFIVHIRTRIDFFLTPLHIIFSEYSNPFIKELIEDNFQNLDIYFGKDCVMCLNDFFSSLGKGLKDEELKLCDYTLAKLDALYKKAEEESKNKIRVFRTLTIFGGASLVILMI